MIGFLIRAVVTAAGLYIASKIYPSGIHVTSLKSLAEAALLLGVVNALVRPVLVFVTFPVTLITLGLFLLVINGLMLELVAFFIHGVQVRGLWAAIIGAVVVGLTSWVASWFVRHDGRIEAWR